MEHFQEPRNLGRMDLADRTGRAAISGGAQFAIYLRIDGDRVVQAKFESFGCGVTVAAGSALTELVEGRSVADCLAITPDQLAEALGGVPPDKRHCPMLAVAALQDALGGMESANSADRTKC
jgi:NifU-like protein involved in Fe-S cluster formation